MTNQLSNTEEDLITRLRDDDIQAFDEIYWKYQKAVYQNVLKITRESLIAEDVVQEVFISLWEKRHTIDSTRPVGGWLFVSSYNRAINALKKNLRESLAIKNMPLNEREVEAEPDSSDIQLVVLEKAIKELSPQKRKVFELCKLQGRSYEEAAKEMNISKHTVKEYLSAAVNSLKEYAASHPKASSGLIGMLVFHTI